MRFVVDRNIIIWCIPLPSFIVLTLDLNNDNNKKYLNMCILNILLEYAQIPIMTIIESICTCEF